MSLPVAGAGSAGVCARVATLRVSRATLHPATARARGFGTSFRIRVPFLMSGGGLRKLYEGGEGTDITRKLSSAQNVTLRAVRTLEAAEDAAEEAEGAALIGGGEMEAAQHEAEVVLVGGLHVSRGIVRGEHDLLDEISEDVEVAGGGAGACGG